MTAATTTTAAATTSRYAHQQGQRDLTHDKCVIRCPPPPIPPAVTPFLIHNNSTFVCMHAFIHPPAGQSANIKLFHFHLISHSLVETLLPDESASNAQSKSDRASFNGWFLTFSFMVDIKKKALKQGAKYAGRRRV